MIPTELNDAAFVVVQLHPTELHEIKALRDSLRQFAVFDASAASQVRACAQQAATFLNLIVLGGSGDDAQLLAQASQAIDAAISAADGVDRIPLRVATATTAGQAQSLPVASLPVPPLPHSRDGGVIPGDTDLSLLCDFMAESRESIAGAEAALLTLEVNPGDIEAINTVFRAFHTVKGTAGFMGLGQLADFAHHAESFLSRVRDRELPYTQAAASLALRSSDVLGDFLDAVEASVATRASIVLPLDHAHLLRDLLDVDAVLTRVTPTTDSALVPAASPRGPAKTEADQSIRVRTDRLDRLIDMVGELVIAQSMIAADPAVIGMGQHELTKRIADAGKIMRELQDLSMSMRMVPLKSTFQKLTRLVRDVAVRAGKVVELVTHGDETELDRTMVDAIADPLVHMVRNAVDHGVETPDDRVRAGKSRAGCVWLSAFQRGGSVIVELRDDGRGLNRDRILAKAIERGLVSSGQALSDPEINALIFAPGFSTAETLTDISGRGVGMDVVRRNIESIRGRIDIQSVAGQGTTFQIRLPLTLAVTDGMLVRVGAERYIVPLTSISLSFRPEPAMLSTIPPDGEVVMLRGEVLPMVRLHELFGISDAVVDPSSAILMLVGDGPHRVALLVDQLLGQQQVVAKTLGDGVGEIPGIAGGAILSDGRVGLIIDVARLTVLARRGDARARGMSRAA